MTSRYVVFQYLPDPATDERINIGVATHGGDGFYSSFLKDWRRVKSFGGSDVRFLQEFARRVESSSGDLPSLFADADSDVKMLFDDAPSRWINAIHVTEPRASTKQSSELIDDISRRFLRARAYQRRGRDRRYVRAVAHELMVGALSDAGVKNADNRVKTLRTVEGAVEGHEFDIAIENGQLAHAALALSFRKQNPTLLQHEYGSAAWAIEDVHKHLPDLPLSVVMLPPAKGTSKTYEQALKVFDALQVRPVPESEIQDWAADVAAAVAGRTPVGPATDRR